MPVMAVLAQGFRRGVEVTFTLSPLIAAVYLFGVQDPPLVAKSYLAHELAVVLATALGLFVAVISVQCYQASGEFFARYVALGLVGFTVTYALHGVLTRTADTNIWLFLLYGPASRLVLATFLFLGVFGYDRDPTPWRQRGHRRYWLVHILAIGAVVPAVAVLAASPIAGAFATRAVIEGVAIALCIAVVVRLSLRRAPFPMKRYVIVAVVLVVESSLVFLMGKAWTHLWWGAHLIFAAGFLVLSYGIMRAWRTTRSFSVLYSEEEMLARLAEARDIQDTLRRAKEEAEAASRSKTEFLAAVSHELRTPLNAIIGFSDSMRQGVLGPLPPAYTGYADDIHASGNHLLAIINDILDVSRIETGHFTLFEEDCTVAELAGSALRLVSERAAGKAVRVDCDIPPDLPWLHADPRRIKQILVNLLANAVKFTPPDGQVTLTAHLTEDGRLAITVRDTGIGIAERDISKALALFGQADSGLERRFEGSGIGLPLSRSLAEMHDGTLDLQSTPGKGTTVTVLLPAHRLRDAPRDTGLRAG